MINWAVDLKVLASFSAENTMSGNENVDDDDAEGKNISFGFKKDLILAVIRF